MNMHLTTTRVLAGLTLACGITVAANAAESIHHKEIEQVIEAADLNVLSLDASVGSIKIKPSSDQQIHIYVKVTEKEDWSLFSDSVEDVELKAKRHGDKLSLRLTDDDFGEEWIIELPKQTQLAIDLGVGSVNVTDITASINIDVGVGEIRVDSQAKYYATIELDSGVGAARISSNIGQVKSHRAMISETATWSGPGQYKMQIDVGVGEVSVRLD